MAPSRLLCSPLKCSFEVTHSHMWMDLQKVSALWPMLSTATHGGGIFFPCPPEESGPNRQSWLSHEQVGHFVQKCCLPFDGEIACDDYCQWSRMESSMHPVHPCTCCNGQSDGLCLGMQFLIRMAPSLPPESTGAGPASSSSPHPSLTDPLALVNATWAFEVFIDVRPTPLQKTFV